MSLKISSKIFIIIASVLIFTAILTNVITIQIFKQSFIETIDDTVAASEKGARNLLSDWCTTLEAEVKMISAQRMLIEYVDTKNYNALQEIILEQVENSECEHLMVADTTGRIIAGNEGLGSSIANAKSFKKAMSGEICYQWTELEFSPFELIYTGPIEKDGEIIGVVITGFQFYEEDSPDEFKDSFSCEFTFFKWDTRISTTLTNNKGERLSGTKLEDQEARKVVLEQGETLDTNSIIDGNMYRCIYSPLKDHDGTIEGMMFIGKSQEIITRTVAHVVGISLCCIAVIFVIIAIISTVIIKITIVKPLNSVRSSLYEIAHGDADLTKRIKTHSRDEIGDVVNGFNKFVDKLHTIIISIQRSNKTLEDYGENSSLITTDTANAIEEIVTNINSISTQIDEQTQSVGQTAGAVNEISSNIESLNKMIEGQAMGIAQASTAVEQMIGNIASVTQSVEKMAESFEELNSNAEVGFRKQQDVNDRVLQIEEQSAMLEDANSAIADIAAQTNLLAMNAAIEAAHAGDAGKGFSVVAGEIRKLSETSSAQSKTIGEQLANIRESIQNVVSASNESSKALNVVAEKIRNTDELVLHIRTAMEEQTEGSKQINEALKTMNDGSSEVKSASLEMAEGNKLILDEVRQLQDATATMKEGMTHISDNTNKISETGLALNAVTAGLKESIFMIGKEINQFKV